MTLESFLTGKIYILIECQKHLLFQKLFSSIKLFCFSSNIDTSNKIERYNEMQYYFPILSLVLQAINLFNFATIHKWNIIRKDFSWEFVYHINIYLSHIIWIHWLAIHTILEAFSDLLFLVGKYRVIQLTDLIS